MKTLTVTLLMSALLVAGCGRLGDSAFNPFRASAPRVTLEPDGGYVAVRDQRPGVPRVTGARWEPMTGGRLLVVTAAVPTKGYSSVKLLTARPQPGDRVDPDADGVLRLRFVARPPLPEDPAASLPANPETDIITAALPLSDIQLSRLTAVEIAGASDVVTLRR